MQSQSVGSNLLMDVFHKQELNFYAHSWQVRVWNLLPVPAEPTQLCSWDTSHESQGDLQQVARH